MLAPWRVHPQKPNMEPENIYPRLQKQKQLQNHPFFGVQNVTIFVG